MILCIFQITPGLSDLNHFLKLPKEQPRGLSFAIAAVPGMVQRSSESRNPVLEVTRSNRFLG